MGNCCSGSSADRNDDPFSKPGRTLNEAPPRNPHASAAVPKNRMGNNGSKQSPSTEPGHTLGGPTPTRAQPDPSMRSAAAKAAEERAKKAQSTGQLGKKLDLQKRQTQSNTLEAASQAERSARVQDTSATSQAYN